MTLGWKVLAKLSWSGLESRTARSVTLCIAPVRRREIETRLIFAEYGCYAEYLEVKAGLGLYKINDDSPENIAMVVSGLTASLALECAGRMTTNETVLVTAAAGGTGSYAVQLTTLFQGDVAVSRVISAK